jgi:hypothetical protein
MHGQTAFGIAFVAASIIIAMGAFFAWANRDIVERTIRQGLKTQQQQGKLPPELQNADIDRIDLDDLEIDVELTPGILFRHDMAVFFSEVWYIWVPVVLLLCFGTAALVPIKRRM